MTLTVSALRRLVSIWSLQQLDDGRDVLVLSRLPDGGTLARYSGIHVAGERSAPGVDVVDLTEKPIAVRGSALSGVLSLLGNDEPVKIGVRASHLHLRTKHARNKLRLADVGILPEVMPPPVEPDVTLLTADLRARVTVMADVTTTVSSSPALSGIQLASDGQTLELRASDGQSAIVARLTPESIEPTPFTTVAAADDLMRALPLLGEHCSITVEEDRRIWLQDADGSTLIRLSPLTGKFPTFAPFAAKTYAYQLPLPTAPFAVAARAAKLIDARQLVTLNADAKTLKLMVEGRELGTFALDVGEADGHRVALRVGAAAVSLLARLGDEVTLNFGDDDLVVCFSRDGYRFWTTTQPTVSA